MATSCSHQTFDSKSRVSHHSVRLRRNPCPNCSRNAWMGKWLWWHILMSQTWLNHLPQLIIRGTKAPSWDTSGDAYLCSTGELKPSRIRQMQSRPCAPMWSIFDIVPAVVFGDTQRGGSLNAQLEMFRYPKRFKFECLQAPVTRQTTVRLQSNQKNATQGLLSDIEITYVEFPAITHAANLRKEI